jgi:hypothetical protein
MIRFCRILIFSFPIFLCAQEPVQTYDSIAPDSLQNEYIIDYKKQFNVKLEVSNDISSFDVIGDEAELNIQPNLNLRYAVVLSYKFLSVRIGVRPKISDEEKEKKGDSDTFRLRLQLLFDNWNHLFEYQSDHGYYVTNTNDFTDETTGNYIQFPDLNSNVIFLSSAYKFNENYSRRAISSQTEIQSKSAGSFMPSASFMYYSITGTERIKDVDGNIINRDFYNEYNGINISLGLAYYYTFVLKKYWFINAFAVPNAGIDFYKTHSYGPDTTTDRNNNDTFLAFNYGFGGGYNGKKIFFGATYKNRLTNEKFSTGKLRISPTNNSFSVYFGYRFKAPKTISAPIDLIEDKVPILKDDN